MDRCRRAKPADSGIMHTGGCGRRGSCCGGGRRDGGAGWAAGRRGGRRSCRRPERTSWGALLGRAIQRRASDTLAVEAVAEGAGWQKNILGPGAVKDGDSAAGRVGSAVVDVHEELVAGFVTDDLEDEASEHPTAGR